MKNIHPEIRKYWEDKDHKVSTLVLGKKTFYHLGNSLFEMIGWQSNICENENMFSLNRKGPALYSEKEILRLIKLKAFL